mgnify:CR=1 FL=1|tara:strand:+ start:9477 stop:9803 length:327 start_codon:yes stop_codon:yes gene_type:complete
MRYSPLPNESDQNYFNRVVVPFVGDRLFTVCFGIKKTSGANVGVLLRLASNANIDVEMNVKEEPESLNACIDARYDELLACEERARRICDESGYGYICRSYAIPFAGD